MPFPFPRLLVRSLACLSLFAFAPLPALADLQSVLQRERTELAEMCGATMQFLEGFAREVNVDGNGAPDILVDYGQLSCDGTRMMFCGSAGCTQKIYLARADGSHAMVAEFLAYELRFDRPSEGTFLAVLHGGSCGRAGVETCFQRYALSGETVEMLQEEPRDRWSFAPAPVPSATLATSQGDSLRLVCDGGSLRIQYGPTWMWEENGSISQHARDLARAQDRLEIEIEVDGGQPTAVPFMIEETARVLQSPTLAPGQPFFAALMPGSFVELHLGGSLEHLRSFTLKGSSQAVGGLLQACGRG
ncbi:hypothetical protein SAMN05421512_104202 [Stappia indica]|uniref:Uncharacterized protein n=2 Tax=Stappia indica TaxID=538381 RepID=A0A285S7U2_9HYPH|nr:hypothetical protein SAMN05421512_104202 [Stappia indica]